MARPLYRDPEHHYPILEERFGALRAYGIKYAPSYHRERHNGFFSPEIYTVSAEPFPDVAAEIEAVPEAASLYGPFTIDEAYVDDFVARWKEIETKYEPDLMWVDHVPVFHPRWNENFRHPDLVYFRESYLEMIEDYLEAADSRGKEVYFNNKGPEGGQNLPMGIGFRESDNRRIDEASSDVWQNPATLGTSYGYLEFEEINDAYKSPTELVHLLCDVVSKNGKLPDGSDADGRAQLLLQSVDGLPILRP